jgi:hypothetical protein
VANPQAADWLAGGWLPVGRIIMTPQRPSNYHPFSICLIMASTRIILILFLWAMISHKKFFMGIFSKTRQHVAGESYHLSLQRSEQGKTWRDLT